MVDKVQVERAILRIDNYIEKHKGNDSLYKMYDIESKYQTKLIQTFKQLKLQDVMWWTKISDRYIKGVPDILCCVVGQFVYFELKAKGNTASPLQKYNMELIENKYNELTQYVPKQQWENDSRQQLIYEKLTNRLNWLESIFKEVVDNAFIKTMNEEALSKLEKEFNIIPSLDQTLEDRKAVLISTLRGIGVTNIARIKNIVESFTNGKVEVITDNPHYFFKVKFVSEMGIPPRINDVRKAIDKVKPAHLDYDFEFKYNTWDDIKRAGITWDYCKTHGITWEDLRTKDLSTL